MLKRCRSLSLTKILHDGVRHDISGDDDGNAQGICVREFLATRAGAAARGERASDDRVLQT